MTATESFARRLIFAFCLALVVPGSGAAQPESASSIEKDHPLLRLMAEELAFSMKHLKTDDGVRPYYLCYTMTHTISAAVMGSLGAIEKDDSRTRRILDVDVRVGDYVLDNTRQIRGGAGDRFSRRADGVAQAPIE